MKWMLATVFAAAIATVSIHAADAKGCIKGAVVGGVAGQGTASSARPPVA